MANYNITMKQLNSSGTYDTLYPATIGSQVTGITGDQISGIYTADQTLTSATAALYGLGADAVPDDVLAKIPSVVGSQWVKIAEYKSAGAFEYVVPLGITMIGAFIGGAGGSGGASVGNSDTSYIYPMASGGGSGYFKNIKPFKVSGGQKIFGVVGKGGESFTFSGSISKKSQDGNPGGSTSFNNISVNGGSGGVAITGTDSSYSAVPAYGGQSSQFSSGYNGVQGDSLAGGAINDRTGLSGQIPSDIINVYEPWNINGAAGGGSSPGASQYSLKESKGGVSSNGKGGDGAQNSADSNVTVTAGNATGNCNGGGSACGINSTSISSLQYSSSLTTGSGSDGMVLIYALKNEAIAAGVEIIE